MKSNLLKLFFAGAIVSGIISCQKESRPALGEYPEDVNVTPSTPLRFFLSFDSSSEADKQINIRFKDSISQYPSFFPDNSISYVPGVSGTAYMGNTDKNLQYYNANDFGKSTSFSVAFWEKHDGPIGSEAQFLFSIPSSAGHWSGGTMFLIFDNPGAGSTRDSVVMKFMVFDKTGENWFELTGNSRMANVLDGAWHHIVFAYDETTSNMNVYRDGALYTTKTWAGHGPVHMDDTKITSFLLGGKCVSGWGAAWGGGVDQFRLYNKALTAAEVQSLFTSKQ